MKILAMKIRSVVVIALVLAAIPTATTFAQAAPAPAQTQAQAPTCKLAEPPPPQDPDPAKRPPAYDSPMRQQCEDELAKDHDWWFNLEGRLRTHTHEQTAKEITTNNRHVVMAYAAIWIIAVGFVVLMWRKQVALRGEIERLSKELTKELSKAESK
jgi:hypothetical protein